MICIYCYSDFSTFPCPKCGWGGGLYDKIGNCAKIGRGSSDLRASVKHEVKNDEKCNVI